VYPSTSNSGVLTAGLHAVEASGYERGRADERRRVLDELDRLRDTDKFGLYPGRTIDSFIRRERRGAEQ
jgi:hypothetical protein